MNVRSYSCSGFLFTRIVLLCGYSADRFDLLSFPFVWMLFLCALLPSFLTRGVEDRVSVAELCVVD